LGVLGSVLAWSGGGGDEDDMVAMEWVEIGSWGNDKSAKLAEGMGTC
jgi:hypothetical protein